MNGLLMYYSRLRCDCDARRRFSDLLFIYTIDRCDLEKFLCLCGLQFFNYQGSKHYFKTLQVQESGPVYITRPTGVYTGTD